METFQKTLGNFIHDFASGDAVRHLADNGLTVDEIVKRLDFPTPKTKVAEIVFQHYIDKGKITLTKPEGAIKSVTYVKEQGEFGRVSMRQVVKTIETNPEDYVLCDFGKQMYKVGKINNPDSLTERAKRHLEALPWPLQEVWVNKELLRG